jgi:hypothetical protein
MLSDATSMEVWSQNSDEGLGSKVEMRKFHDVWKSEFLWLIYDSSNNVTIVRFKIPDNQSWNLSWKMRLVRERKCSGKLSTRAINTEFLLAFYKSNSQMQVFW